jgi:putative pyruvate formate lyase activating enzyme
VYKEFVHLGEEKMLIPSHAIYMTGCNFRCTFCSDDAYIRDTSRGAALSSAQLAERIEHRRAQGCKTVNFVGGCPEVNILAIVETLSLVRGPVHVVWNTNLWSEPLTFARLDGVVDTWLADLKFGNDACGKLAGVSRYTETLHSALRLAVAARGRVIVRHLLMPGHLECCTRPVLDWLGAELPEVGFNLMTQFVPFASARHTAPLNRKNTREERDMAAALLEQSTLANVMLDGEVLRWTVDSGHAGAA